MMNPFGGDPILQFGRDSLPCPEKIRPEVFAPLDLLIELLDKWGHYQLLEPITALADFKVLIVARVSNLLKACRLLLRDGYWEDATILVRSVYELVLNVEEIFRMPDLVEDKARTFLDYGVLQQHLELRANLDYEVFRNVISKEESGIEELDREMRTVFSRFLVKGKASRRHPHKAEWMRNWSGKNVKELSDASPYPLRPKQYSVLYSAASGYVHSSPVSVVGLVTYGDECETMREAFLHQEVKKTTEVLSLAVSLCLEILTHTGDVFMAYDPVKLAEIGQLVCDIFEKKGYSKGKMENGTSTLA